MKGTRILPWSAVGVGALYFFVPLLCTFEFSLRMRRGAYSFDAYRVVFADPRFQESFSYSAALALASIVVGIALVVPAAYAVRLRLPSLRGAVELLTLMPLVVPAIVLVFGYLRIYGSASILPLTDNDFGVNLLLVCGYITLALPYLYRAVDTGLAAIDVHTLTEAAESLGAGPLTVLVQVILPNLRAALAGGAFLTFAIVIGEFTIASLLDRQTFGPYMQLLGANRAYEPAALAVLAFLLTWGSMAALNVIARRRPDRK